MPNLSWNPSILITENSRIERRLLESSYNFKSSNEHERQQCVVLTDTLDMWIYKCLVKLFAL